MSIAGSQASSAGCGGWVRMLFASPLTYPCPPAPPSAFPLSRHPLHSDVSVKSNRQLCHQRPDHPCLALPHSRRQLTCGESQGDVPGGGNYPVAIRITSGVAGASYTIIGHGINCSFGSSGAQKKRNMEKHKRGCTCQSGKKVRAFRRKSDVKSLCPK